MDEIKYLTDHEVQELIYRIGDVILDINASDRPLPEEYMTGFHMLQAAHSMMAEKLPKIMKPQREGDV